MPSSLFIHPFSRYAQSTYYLSIIGLGTANTELKQRCCFPKYHQTSCQFYHQTNLLELAAVRENTTLMEFQVRMSQKGELKSKLK